MAADAADRNYTYIPDPSTWKVPDDAAYVHYIPNETIQA